MFQYYVDTSNNFEQKVQKARPKTAHLPTELVLLSTACGGQIFDLTEAEMNPPEVDLLTGALKKCN